VGKKKKKNIIFSLFAHFKSKMDKLKYLSGGQIKNKNLFWNKIFFMFCLLWSTILTVKMDVEEGGIKIKKKIFFFHENGNCLGRKSEKKQKMFIFIPNPNHHFWMSEGSLNKE
jgi:hypothetical protein